MDNSLKGLLLASGVIITCIVVSLGFFIAREAKNASNNGVNQISNMSMAYQDVSKTLYDGLRVSGKEVLEVIDRYEDELKEGSVLITVVTGKKAADKRNVEFDSVINTTATARDYGTVRYVNPNGTFLGAVQTDANGMVFMKFEQQ